MYTEDEARIRPIIFSGPMVSALLEGSKTQTRRITPCPLMNTEVGDLLYVREAFAYCGKNAYPASDCMKHPRGGDSVIHRVGWDRSPPASGWRSSIHMPRWASRLTLRVKRVFHESVTQISENDAKAEGVFEEYGIVGAHCAGGTHAEVYGYRYFPTADADDEGHEYAGDAFQELWDSLHTKPGETWADDPMVVALEFEVIRGNVDTLKDAY